ncbi:uncharacterized protein [Diadema antillarum]|uniref:uncharacterized protein n=1 Tax=Diadema antillarum TaxID=105358 RepID=UPI003A895568
MAEAVCSVNHRFHGGWKIVGIDVKTKDASNSHASGLEGVEFHLSDTGDIIWKLPPGLAEVPFFVSNFDLYEITGTKIQSIKFVGSQSGDKIEMQATQKRPDTLHLKYEDDFTFQCSKVWKIERAIEAPYSLQSALHIGFFTDLTIKADSGKEFTVHKVILKASCPQLAWDQTPPPLSGHPEDVLTAVLHFLYTECLPESIQEETARRCLAVASKLPGFGRLANLCQLYLKNVAVKNQIISYINDMHTCGDRLAQIFSNKTTTMEGSIRMENFMEEPAKLVYALKQAIREAAIAGVKFLMVCDVFQKRKGEMSKNERHEVMKYVKSRLPRFVEQLYKFFENFREQLTRDVSPSQKQDVAVYLVPEMERSLDLSSELVEMLKNALETILRGLKAKEKKKNSTVDYLNRLVKNAMYNKEMKQLKGAHEKMCELFQSMMWRQEAFECLSMDDKIFSVNKNIEQVEEEFPQILQKINKLNAKVNEGFSMKNWKFVFKMGTSKVMWSLEKVVIHRDTFRPLVERIASLIDRDAFTSALVQLGCLAPTPMEEGGEGGASQMGDSSVGAESAGKPATGKQPNTVESLCVPPSSSESKLAKAMGQLLQSGVNTDMCFEVVTFTEEPSDIVVDHTQGEPIESQSSERMESRHILKAHCVVIAARCDWFRRALLSGMRESIDKKIEVHDTDPTLFQQFLVFLYSGQIDTSSMTTDQIADMMSLSDRYEVDTLKHVCEAALKSKLNEDTVLFLLSLADQFHAKTLREGSLNFIMQHPGITEQEVYEELSENLKKEVQSLVEWIKSDTKMDGTGHYKETLDSSSDSSSEDSIEKIAQELMHVGSKKHSQPLHSDSDSMSSDEESATNAVAMDRQQMLECIARVKEVIGDAISAEDLEKLVQVADFDVNRAINFFYGSAS